MADQPRTRGSSTDARGSRASTERVADADRDRTVTMLREHVVDGRLTLDEFSERVGLALEARTRGDLDAVMANLPDAARPLSASMPEPQPGVARPGAGTWRS